MAGIATGRNPMRTKILRPLLLVASLLLLIWLGWLAVTAHQAGAQAEAFAKRELWSQARLHWQRYLWLHPADDEARLGLAEALVNDRLLSPEEATRQALDVLSRIADDAPQAARARTQQARLELLILRRPAAAERLLRRAMALDEQFVDAHYMLWKLFELTGRSEYAEPIFWDVYERSDPSQRSERLRQWYMCQFYPVTANPELEYRMGLLGADEVPSTQSELRRFAMFRQQEPDEPLAYAAIAGWLLAEGNPVEAVKLLEETSGRLVQAHQEPLFAAALVAGLFDLGEFERAVKRFEQWPPPREGYAWWKWKAMLLDEVDGDFQGAVAAYQQALRHWPGPADWRTHNRLAQCLTRIGRQEEAGQQRESAKRVEQLMEESVHERLRVALARLDSPRNLNAVAAFYRQLGCPREAEGWDVEIQRLQDMSGNPSKPEVR